MKGTMKRTLKTIAKVSAALFTILILAHATRAQVQVAPLAIPRAQFLSATGVPLAAGCVTFNATGTSTPQAIYADSGGVNQLANPLTLDAAGEADVWMSNTGYDITAYTGVNGQLCSVQLGSQLWQAKNKNPFSIINQGSNFIVASGTSDPAGVQGELNYRTDLACLRIFTSLWDCLATLTGTQTLQNKTLNNAAFTGTATGLVASSPQFTSPSIVGLTAGGIVVASGNPVNFENFTNDTVTGTTLNTLTKLKILGAGSTAVIAAITDIGGIEGVVVGGAGTSGLDVIQRSGQVLCVFDGATTVLDYVQISSSVAGNCHDTGSASYPTSGGQVIGRSLSTQVGAGTYLIELFGAEIRGVPATVASVNLTAQAANIASTPLFTPAANGFYRFSCYTVVTQAATTSSTLPQCQVLFNDADTNVAETQAVTTINTGNTLGALGGLNATNATPWLFAKSGVAISYQTSSYASSGATPMQYAVHVRLEGPF